MTSTTVLLPALYALGLYFAFAAGSLRIRAEGARVARSGGSRFPRATVLLVTLIAVSALLQFRFPTLLPILRRDTTRVLDGEWWRLPSALFVQDGGIAGAAFNIIALLLVGAVAEQLWHSGKVVGIFFIGGIAGELVALAWQPIGAGNSVGNFALAAAVAVACLRRGPSGTVRLLALLCLTTHIILLALRDIHGAAAVAGAGLALLLSPRRYANPQPRHTESDQVHRQN